MNSALYSGWIAPEVDPESIDLKTATSAGSRLNLNSLQTPASVESLTGLRKTVQWYLDNLEWCQRVQDGSYQGQRLGFTEPKDLIA